MPDSAGSPTIVIIDDDDPIREALSGLFASVNLAVAAFGSVDAYIGCGRQDLLGCMVLDVRLPGKSGLDFIEELARAGVRRSIVCISGHADVAMSVRAMKAGAIEFLTKPVRDQDLLDAVQRALEHDRHQRSREDLISAALSRYATLTPRERTVMEQVLSGRLNRQIADGIGITEATVKLHRGQVMRKMGTRSLIELVRAGDLVSG